MPVSQYYGKGGTLRPKNIGSLKGLPCSLLKKLDLFMGFNMQTPQTSIYSGNEKGIARDARCKFTRSVDFYLITEQWLRWYGFLGTHQFLSSGFQNPSISPRRDQILPTLYEN